MEQTKPEGWATNRRLLGAETCVEEREAMGKLEPRSERVTDSWNRGNFRNQAGFVCAACGSMQRQSLFQEHHSNGVCDIREAM